MKKKMYDSENAGMRKIMTKEDIIKIFQEEAKKTAVKADNSNLKIRLLQITQKFVETFDYELPKANGIIEKSKKLIKRAIRKSIRFVTKPYAERMLEFQNNICELLGMYIEKFDDIYKKLDRMDRQQEYFAKKLRELEKSK